MSIKNWLENRYTTTIWDSKVPDSTDIEYIKKCAYLAPSKQCYGASKLLLLTESDKAKEIKSWLRDEENNYLLNVVHKGKEKNMHFHTGQYAAPILLVWLLEDDYEKHPVVNILDKDTTFVLNSPSRQERICDCHISATCAMLGATEIGLNTGFASCNLINQPNVKEKLNIEGHSAVITLGIGFAKDTSDMPKWAGCLVPSVEDPSAVDEFDAVMDNMSHNKPIQPQRLNKVNYEDFILTI